MENDWAEVKKKNQKIKLTKNLEKNRISFQLKNFPSEMRMKKTKSNERISRLFSDEL